MRALVVAVALVAACSRPSPPIVIPERASVSRIDAAGVALDVSMRVTNPNSVDLTATSVSSHLIVDRSLDVAAVTLPRTIALPAGQTTELVVPISVTWSDIGALAQLATRAAGVPYAVDGTLEVGGPLLHFQAPFHLEGAIAREQITAAVMGSLTPAR
ncbi:MAG TPA: LEA type 2 family protein [Polyangiaceae bacterium]|nr:LEA type 2 family protein [Polyangiaceae bacterium]